MTRRLVSYNVLVDYAIEYDLAGGTMPEGEENETVYNMASGDIVLLNPVREGYDFVGWTGTGLGEASLSVTIPSGSYGDREYQAQWKVSSPTEVETPEALKPSNESWHDLGGRKLRSEPTRQGLYIKDGELIRK